MNSRGWCRIRKELDLYLADNHSAWLQQADGTYVLVQPTAGAAVRNAQAQLLERYAGLAATAPAP